MRIEIDSIGNIEPGRGYGYNWRVVDDRGEIVISGWSAGKKRRAQQMAKACAERLGAMRAGTQYVRSWYAWRGDEAERI